MPRFTVLCLILGCVPMFAQSTDEKAATATVQKLFDAMAAHDSDAARAVLIADGRIVAVRENGAVSNSTQEQFAARLSTIKEPIIERMWQPKVLVQGRLAQVWAEYDFWRSGKFSHCGIDSVSLVKTEEGWKISGISYSMLTTTCSPSPLGPPATSPQ
ncbi:MAG: nuclear transport factor 2 family protein [Acidobacteriaceae bacterium]|nr:nuclear transport factor 2 family protein [Acidobacteriaceae bacterium]